MSPLNKYDTGKELVRDVRNGEELSGRVVASSVLERRCGEGNVFLWSSMYVNESGVSW